MTNWFECKVKHEKTMENGLTKNVKESYIVDALTCSEAEARIIEYMTPYISGEFEVSDIKTTNYTEIFFNDNENADMWFKCKLSFITLDERTGTEKRTNSYVLVQASDIRNAIKYVDDQMKGTISDYRIASIQETSVMDVVRWELK